MVDAIPSKTMLARISRKPLCAAMDGSRSQAIGLGAADGESEERFE